MTPTVFNSSRRFTRLALVWLLAVVLPLQSTALGIFNALGPSHIHNAAQSDLVLQDVRRWKPSPVREWKLSSLLGHSHGSVSAQRHYHPVDDSSVVNVGLDSTAGGSGVDDGLSTVTLLASFWVSNSDAVAWQPLDEASNAFSSRPFWTATSVFVAPHDRPPKSTA